MELTISLPFCVGQQVYILGSIYTDDSKFPIPKIAQLLKRTVQAYHIVYDDNITYDITVNNPNNGSCHTYSGYAAKSKIFASRKEAIQFAKSASINIINPKGEE